MVKLEETSVLQRTILEGFQILVSTSQLRSLSPDSVLSRKGKIERESKVIAVGCMIGTFWDETSLVALNAKSHHLLACMLY